MDYIDIIRNESFQYSIIQPNDKGILSLRSATLVINCPNPRFVGKWEVGNPDFLPVSTLCDIMAF